MISSTMPSAKYSCLGSPLIFWNGSTAIDGLSGSAKGGFAGVDISGQCRGGRSRLRRVPPASAHYKPARVEPLPSHPTLAHNIAVFELAFGEHEHGRIADGSDFQLSDIGAIESHRRGGCTRADDINELHSEAEEFRHRHQLVESRPVDAERMNIATDYVRLKPCREHRLGRAKAERTAAVSDVKNDPAPPCFEHFLADLAIPLYGRIGKRAEAMRQHVSPAQTREHFEPARWRVIKMRHEAPPALRPTRTLTPAIR